MRNEMLMFPEIRLESGATVSYVDQLKLGVIQVEQTVHLDGRFIRATLMLTREEAAHVATTLQAWLNETDPEYQAWIAELESGMKHNPDAPATVNPDQLKAYEAMVKPALPATDAEWKARLVEGGVA